MRFVADPVRQRPAIGRRRFLRSSRAVPVGRAVAVGGRRIATSDAVAAAGPSKPLATEGSIVSLANEGALWLVDAGGARTLLASADGGPFTFPAWSPDGSRIAAIRYGPDANHILVFDAASAAAGDPAEPVVLLEARNIAPFYLSWTPDGAGVSYLANEANGLSFRFAPADGSAPLDGSGPGSTVATGNPFYFDWIDVWPRRPHRHGPRCPPRRDRARRGADRSGPRSARKLSARQTRPRMAGRSPSSARTPTGRRRRSSRTATARPSRRSRSATSALSASTRPATRSPCSVRSSRPRHRAGSRSDRSACSIARPGTSGPCSTAPSSRSGGRPMAGRSPPCVSSPSRARTRTRPPGSRRSGFFFLDPATGEVRSDAPVVPGRLFLDQVFPFFDQYAVSHELWAPDSSSFLLPTADRERLAVLTAFYVNGDDPEVIDGSVGFWSP